MTQRPDETLRPAMPETFDEEAYLLANPDVMGFVRNGGCAADHFRQHGHAEGRMQRAPHPVPRGQRKYERFRHILDPGRGAGGGFRFLREEGRFPVGYGATSHVLSEYDGESAHPGFGDFVSEVEAHPDRLYADIGCGRRNYTHDNCLYLEVYPSVSADLVMEPACVFPIASASLDGIGCFAVLEHMTEPWIAAEEFRRILKPGGLVFIDWPFLQPVHGYPSHYYNATRQGLSRLFDAGFEQVSLATLPNQTQDHMVSWVLSQLAASIADEGLRDSLLDMRVRDLLSEAPGSPFWSRINAALPAGVQEALACGNTLVARKL